MRNGALCAVSSVLLLVVALPVEGRQLRNGPGGEPPLDLPRIERPIVIDGRVDEPGWEGAARPRGIVQVPDFGAEPSQRREFARERSSSLEWAS